MEAVNLEQRLFLAADGETFPIVRFYADGVEIDGPDGAQSCVAGTEGRWFAVDLALFQSAPC